MAITGMNREEYKRTPLNFISELNSRDASDFAANATFQGVSENVHMWGRVGVSITSSNRTSGTLTMEVSRDGTTWGGPTRRFEDTRFAQPHMWNIVEKYFRIKYVNDHIAASDLQIQVQYSNNADILLGHQLDETLIDETEAIITRSVILGRDEKGNYANVTVDLNNNLHVVDQSSLDMVDLQRDILKELRIISLKLNVLQNGDENLDLSELDQLDK